MPVQHAAGLLTVPMNGAVTAGFRTPWTTISVGCRGGTLSGEQLSMSCNVDSIGKMALSSFIKKCK